MDMLYGYALIGSCGWICCISMWYRYDTLGGMICVPCMDMLYVFFFLCVGMTHWEV